MHTWIIIGGGIQGMTLANFLRKQKGATPEEIAIIDPHAEPLADWKRCTENISMPFLRSPFVHHIDVDPFSLNNHAKQSPFNEDASFLGRLKRPSLPLFHEHCDHLIREQEIHRSWIQGRVEAIKRLEDGWHVQLESGTAVSGTNIVLAIGAGEQLHWPQWAVQLQADSQDSVFHVFDRELPEFDALQAPFTVIGGGITAVHLTLKLQERFPGQVTLMKRHPFRVHDFDSDPGWLGPKYQRTFRKTRSYKSRREMIVRARRKGSIPSDLHAKIRRQLRHFPELVIDGHVHQAVRQNGGTALYNEHGQLLQKAGTVILATGFQPQLPGREWLAPIIKELHLPCAECGYPVLTHTLQWGPGLYVMGPLAELEVGPIARNISGAREAASRIIAAQ
ncbi:FAD/NAD(P)-binding protein [Planococcus sp. ISL-109]|uniref:FAD/NAD(P)-binding protein n=1 Tax=Planococcus sp. ISL-109 TaxID=2819166 RepID=UPI001BEB945E|nr:FAD/NAD(P)-binding protein [Planococcus sp. ISL-109]MBT2583246.1 SidA/IucD/PvdA family monooxygenase [Planococcus sp. ISL-109]